MYAGSDKIVRQKKYDFIAVAIDQLAKTPATVINSWHVCGITKALFGIEPPEKYKSHLGLNDELVVDLTLPSDNEIDDILVDDDVREELLAIGGRNAPIPEEKLSIR
jgi:hypothetical protein